MQRCCRSLADPLSGTGGNTARRTPTRFSLRTHGEARLDRPAFAADNRMQEDRFAALGRCHSQGLGVNGIREWNQDNCCIDSRQG